MKNILHSFRSPLWKDAALLVAIAAVTALHYLTDPHAHQLHDIYRRLYYLPIILAAFHRGIAGGLVAAVVVCLAYLPHALGHISHDPASDTQKALEMLLYLAVGSVTGLLVSRLMRSRRQLEATAEELRRNLDTMQAMEKELVQSARLAAVGRLSAGLAHEIRNPLASIKGSAELLADDFPPGHKKRRLFEVLIEESGRLNEVLTRFLRFARPQPVDAGRVQIAKAIDAVVDLLKTQEAGQSVIFRRNPAVIEAAVKGDAAQIRQVLLNILLNACQAAGPGGKVDIAAKPSGSTVTVAIQDSGPGFTQEALDSAFTPFFTTRPAGTGLGLAESHRIVEAHGGRILLGNAASGGARVTLELPAAGS